jgi:RES domain-containing protein
VRLSAWRIVPSQHQATAFTGDGSRMFSGRWNSAGMSVVYTAGSISLAILEVLVHLREATTMPDYLLIEARFDDSLLAAIDETQLPPNWRRDPAPETLKQFGDDWIRGQHSVVLRVPSSITGEPNYLLNPLHPKFTDVQIGAPQPLLLDPRLVPESLFAKPKRKRRR